MNGILNRLSNKERLLLGLTMALVGLALWCSYLLAPMIKEWKRVSNEVSLKELAYRKYALVASRQAAVQQRYRQAVTQLKARGSDQEQMALFLKEIEALARDKVNITNIRPRSVTDLRTHKRFNVEIDCESTMEPLVRFIYEAERSRSMLRIERLRIQTKSGETGLLEVSMLLSRISVL
ncbi:MAG: hypothetical protein V1694_07175 [Candidatus Eisenbacteria bacterium]